MTVVIRVQLGNQISTQKVMMVSLYQIFIGDWVGKYKNSVFYSLQFHENLYFYCNSNAYLSTQTQPGTDVNVKKTRHRVLDFKIIQERIAVRKRNN